VVPLKVQATVQRPAMKEPIHSNDAPAAIGPYSQAIRSGHTLYLSGQVGLDPATMTLIDGLEAQAHQVFRNLRAVVTAAGGSMDDIVKVSILMVDLAGFAKVNEIMAGYFAQPYPARATYQVAALPRGALIEIEGIAVLTPAGAAPATGWRETFDQTKGQ
jgi:reactive intermediate/imine deaminase